MLLLLEQLVVVATCLSNKQYILIANLHVCYIIQEFWTRFRRNQTEIQFV